MNEDEGLYNNRRILTSMLELIARGLWGITKGNKRKAKSMTRRRMDEQSNMEDNKFGEGGRLPMVVDIGTGGMRCSVHPSRYAFNLARVRTTLYPHLKLDREPPHR